MRLDFALLLVAALSGCGLSPSNSEVEQALTRGNPLVGNVYQVGNVRRTNGYEQPEGYVVEFSAEIQILENPAVYQGHLAKDDETGIGTIAALSPPTGGLAEANIMKAAAIFAAKRGDVFPFSGAMAQYNAMSPGARGLLTS